MAKTRHIQQRMSQRSIKEEMVNIALTFGSHQREKVILKSG